jgi:hypothetical protein
VCPRLVFFLFNVTTFAWVTALLFRDTLLFQEELFGATLFWGVFGLVVLITCFWALKAIRDTSWQIIEMGRGGQIQIRDEQE